VACGFRDCAPNDGVEVSRWLVDSATARLTAVILRGAVRRLTVVILRRAGGASQSSFCAEPVARYALLKLWTFTSLGFASFSWRTGCLDLGVWRTGCLDLSHPGALGVQICSILAHWVSRFVPSSRTGCLDWCLDWCLDLSRSGFVEMDSSIAGGSYVR